MDDGVAALATSERADKSESTNRFVYVNAANNEILDAEARQLDSVEYRGRLSKACVAVVEAKE